MSFYSRWVGGARRLFSLQHIIDELILPTLHLHYEKETSHPYDKAPHNIEMYSH